MKRYTGQKALYEAISRSRARTKPERGGILERLRPLLSRPAAPPEETPEPRVAVPPPRVEAPKPAAEKPVVPAERPVPAPKVRPIERIGRSGPVAPAQNWLRPKPVQLNGGRIEISVPYYVGVSAALGVVLLLLIAFRLGRAGQQGGGVPEPVRPAASVSPTRPQTPEDTGAASTASLGQPSTPEGAVREVTAGPARPQGDNWIVLTRYPKKDDLVHVVEHYAEYGIELLVVPLEQARATFAQYKLNASALPSGDGYLLVTADTYENPSREGTDGYKMVQEIARVGALYKGKAPPGSESFAPNYFSDAYGMKIR